MAEVLAEFLGEWLYRRFDWTSANCLTFCADWVLRATGKDPAAQWRCQYSDKRSALKLMRREGGAIPLVERVMTRADFQPVAKPVVGDIALVWAPVGKVGPRVLRRPTGSICLGKSFVLLTGDMGLVMSPMEPIKAWGIGYA